MDEQEERFNLNLSLPYGKSQTDFSREKTRWGDLLLKKNQLVGRKPQEYETDTEKLFLWFQKTELFHL